MAGGGATVSLEVCAGHAPQGRLGALPELQLRPMSGAARGRDTRSASGRRPALSYIVVFRLLHSK